MIYPHHICVRKLTKLLDYFKCRYYQVPSYHLIFAAFTSFSNIAGYCIGSPICATLISFLLESDAAFLYLKNLAVSSLFEVSMTSTGVFFRFSYVFMFRMSLWNVDVFSLDVKVEESQISNGLMYLTDQL